MILVNTCPQLFQLMRPSPGSFLLVLKSAIDEKKVLKFKILV
jgi:hypothetical protein